MRISQISIFIICVSIFCTCQRNDVDKESKNTLEKLANNFIDIIVNQKDIDAFVELYHDSVEYSDPVWGVVDEFVQRDTLKLWFTPVFDPQTGWDFEIDVIALDPGSNTFAFKGRSIDLATGENRLITSWIEVNQGKIVRQTDLTPWSLSSLKYSPRFEEALKNFEIE